MKRILPVLLCLCLLLCACQSEPEQPATDATTVPTAEPTTTPTTEATEEATVPTTEATEETVPPTTEVVVLYRHPITGEPLDAPLTVRPVAVVTNNISAAQPMMGIGSADIIFEHMAEGGGSITRVLAVYTDLENAGTLGSIRSARTYLLDLARVFDAPMAHCGYSSYARKNIKQTNFPSYDQFSYPDYYYRDSDRLDSGYSSEHTMMIQGSDLLKGLQESGFSLEAPADAYYGMQFEENVDLNGESAVEISFRFYSSTGKRTTLSYDAVEGVYYATQKWTSKQCIITDGNTGDPVPFKNVLILSVKVRHADDGKHMLTTMTGEGDGYFACNGKYVPIKWYRESVDDPFTYTFEDGTPVTFDVGKTYVAMLPTKSPAVSFE